MHSAPAASYDDRVTPLSDLYGDLTRARHLALASAEEAAKDLLLSLMPRIEATGRDDLMLEVYAQLGELYLVRTAYDGVTEGLNRIRSCLRRQDGCPRLPRRSR